VGISFEEQLRLSHLIFVGTVDKEEYVSRSGVRIIKRYHFDQVRYLKGEGPPELTLSQTPNTEDEPGFRKGIRYVVFADQGIGEGFERYYRANGCMWAPFGIWADSGSADPVVHWGDRGPLVAARDRFLARVIPRDWESANPPVRVKTYDASGNLTDDSIQPVRPPRRPLIEELQLADSADARQAAMYSTSPSGHDPYVRMVRLVGLWPHQDPGTRVGEDEFVAWLKDQLSKETAK